MGPVGKRLFLLLACLAAWMPFVGRPLFIDDHAHFREAVLRGLDPARPYDERGLGWRPGETPGEANPPIYFYLVGGITRVLGPHPGRIHLALISLHLLGMLAFFSLARRYTRHPLWASLLWLTTPHYWLTANSLLLDSLLAPFFLIGLWGWISGWENRSSVHLAVGALFLGLTPLVKYTGYLAWAVVGLWAVLNGHRRDRRWLWSLIPLALSAAWLTWSGRVYGGSHLAATASASVVPFDFSRLRDLLVFFLVSTPVALIGLISGSAALGAASPANGLAAVRPGRAWDRTDALLFAWVAAGLAGLLFARGWVCARYFVVVGPAAILLSVRLSENARWAESRAFRSAALGVLAASGAVLAAADYFQARVDRNAARDLEAARERLSTDVHGCYPAALLSGLSAYLPPDRWRPLEPGEKPSRGEAAAIPLRQLPRAFWPDVGDMRPAALFSYRSPLPVRLQDGPTGAGWYGSVWGHHPLSLTTAPLETYLFLVPSPATGDSAPRDPTKK